MATAEIKNDKLNDVVLWGLRAAVGVIFIAHGIPKFDPEFVGLLSNIGMPPEAQIPIALLEVIGGTVLIVGVLSRISAAMLSMNMLGAIFVLNGLSNLTGDRGYEINLILLAANLVIIALGPGRISISHIVKKIPRFLH